MNVQTFYGIFAATCFTLVGLWWTVVRARPDWIKDEEKRNLAGGVYLAFLIPGLMGLFAQIGGDNKLFWRATFVVTGLVGIFFTTRLIQKTRTKGPQGPFRRNRWLGAAMYAVIILIGFFPGLAGFLGLQPLQLEAILLCLLILIAHGLTWEFMTEPPPVDK